MPEKPKRRKNNKNKRQRNKNKQDSNKTNDVETTSTDSCSISVDGDKQEISFNEEVIMENSSLSIEVSSVCHENKTNKSSDNMQGTREDLNSNSADLPDLNSIVISKTCDEELTGSIPFDAQCVQQYVVESPEQSAKGKAKLNSNVKSKSLDNDDSTKIVEITVESNSQSDEDNPSNLVNSESVLVSDADYEIEWENTDDLKEDQMVPKDLTEESSKTCEIPITMTHNEQNRILTSEEEKSLRDCLNKLPLTNTSDDSSEIIIQTVQVINQGVKHRLRKKASADDFIFHRLGPPRTLDVIDEEGSGESSKSSRRQSYLNEKRHDNEDLDDDVFEDTIKKEKYVTKMNKGIFGRQIEQPCMLVDAKLKEPEVSEARGDWSVTNVDKMIGAEVVYLTDTSSSTSSLYDNSEEGDDGIETDVSVRMITPTIEVTDTETLLKETFAPRENITHIKIDAPVIEEPKHVVNASNDKTSPTSHEIVILSTDNITTNLTVKDVVSESNEIIENKDAMQTGIPIETSIPDIRQTGNEYDIEMKVLKCELNDAINNLIKEVSSDSESSEKNDKQILIRQDSSSSVESSQCTAKYNPTYSSLNDVANIVHDGICETSMNNRNAFENNNLSHVKDVFECVTGITTHLKNGINNEPSSLKDLCVKKVAAFPYGDKILEELASVSKRLQNITIYSQKSNNHEKINEAVLKKVETQHESNMPYYPLPDVSCIEKVSLQSKEKDNAPPPVQPRNSSLKLSQDENHWVGMPTETEPVYVCLSPSQKMLMEKTNTVITKGDASHLVDMHKKYVDRRGYNEYYNKDQRKETQRLDNPPVVPFKSQTGSRLLALIRDPAVTDNINSIKTKNQLKMLDQIQPIAKSAQSTYKKYEHYNSAKEIPTKFKPIPPPRTRKFSSSFYESDESSDFTDSSFRSIRNERKLFHFSTGNLSKEIENDISSIQNMHRHCTDIRDHYKDQNSPRRPSLPKDLCDQQMEYIRKKEKEVEAEIRRLENEKLNIPEQEKPILKNPLILETKVWGENITRTRSQSMTLRHDADLKLSTAITPKVSDKPEKGKLSAFSSSQEELLRDKMYSEYVNQMAEREERRQQKVIKITNNNKQVTTPNSIFSKSMPTLDFLDSKVNNRIEKEFICKARERWNKLGIKDPETEDERDISTADVYREPKVIEHKIKVIEGGEEKDVKKLPNHLQDFVRFTVKDTDQGKSSPGESSTGPASPHVMILCAVIILVLAVGKIFLRMFRNK